MHCEARVQLFEEIKRHIKQELARIMQMEMK